MGCNGSSLGKPSKFSSNSSTLGSTRSKFDRKPAICVVADSKNSTQPCEKALRILDQKVKVKGFSDRNDNNGVNMLFSEQEHRFRSGDLESGNAVGFDSENDDDDDLHFAMNGGFSKESRPKRNDFESSEADTDGILIPGLPNDLAQLCLMRVPFVKYDNSLRKVSKSWRNILSSQEFYATRTAFKISETFISFVVHGNRVQIFNLKEHSWFCLPPLPLDRAISSPEWNVDPYEWWQIETVAALHGTLFVMGGDQATIYNCIRPTEPANTVHKYDFCKNKWIKVAPMQVPRSNSAAVTLKKSILVAGGNEEMEEGASAEVYDPMTNCWSFVSRMHSSMKSCVGVEHRGLVYVKGANLGSGSPIEGELYDPVKDSWIRMNPGLRRGLARGPIASANSQLFVADWKDCLLKMYAIENDSWEIIAGLPAKISRLVGHRDKLYGLTGKIKVDPYNHHVISDSPDGVWQLDLGKRIGSERRDWLESVTRRNCIREFDWRREDSREAGRLDLGLNSNSLKARVEFRMISMRGRETDLNSRQNMLDGLGKEDDDGSEFSYRLGNTEDNKEYVWNCIWREPKQNLKTGSLSWVPSSAHCALLED